MKVESLLVTPALAAEWLGNNDANRSLNKRLVADYARDIASGNWAINGETIKIGVSGRLLDGQHRAAAVVLADVAVKMLVVSGLDDDAQDTVDMGRKRTFNDVLAIKGVKHSAPLASIAKRVWSWDNGDKKFSNNVRPTTSELSQWIEENPAVHRSAEMAWRTYRSFRVLSQSASGTSHFLFNRIDPDDTAEFFAQLGTGAGLVEGHPVLVLRSRLMRDMAEGKRVPDMVRIGLVIKAWNTYRKGETISRIEMHTDSIMPEPR